MSGFPDSFPAMSESDAGAAGRRMRRSTRFRSLRSGAGPWSFRRRPCDEGQQIEIAAPEVPTTFDPAPVEESLFARYEYVAAAAAPQRIPNFGHFVVFPAGRVSADISRSGLVIFAALHFHLFGVSTFKQAEEEIHYRLGSQAAWYVITLVVLRYGSFRSSGATSFFDGLEWRASAAARHRWRLFGAAARLLCRRHCRRDPASGADQYSHRSDVSHARRGVAAVRVWSHPRAADRRDRLSRLPAAGPVHGLRLGCGTDHRIAGRRRPDDEWRPSLVACRRWWSLPSISSIPFALMHGDQTAYSLGPFLLLVCVSLVLCWVRLATRSLAASVMVHSSYNLLLFSLMFLGTGGFRHLDKM